MISKLFYSLLSIGFVSLYQVFALWILGGEATPEDLGILTLLITINAFLFLFVDFGLSNYFLHRKYLSKVSTIKLKGISNNIGFTIMLACFIVSLIYAFLNHDNKISTSIALLGINAYSLSLTRIPRVQLQNQGLFKSIFVIDIISRMLGVFLIYALLNLSDLDVLSIYMLSSVILNSFAYILVLLYEKKEIFSYGDESLTGLKDFCIPQALNSLINFLTQNVDIFIVATVAGLEVSGVYGVIKIITTKAVQVYMPTVLKVFTPMIIKSEKPESEYVKLVFLCSCLSSIVYSSFIFLDEWLLYSVFNLPEESETLQAFYYFCLYTTLRAICMPVGIIITRTGNTLLGLYYSTAQILVLTLSLYLLGQNLVLVTQTLLFYQLLLLLPHWQFLIKPHLKLSFVKYHFYSLIPLVLPLIIICIFKGGQI